MILLDGKKTSRDIQEEIAIEVSKLMNIGGRRPHLAAILVGTNGASETYVNAKVLACKRVGFKSTLFHFDDNISESELLSQIDSINKDEDIDGLIV